MKLSDCPPHLRRRIEEQLAHDSATLRPVSAAVAQPHQPRPVAPADSAQKRRARRVVISLIALRRRPLDPDNNAASFKHLQDAIAATIGLDDGDPRLVWQYQQMHTYGSEGVIVRIEFE